MSLRQPRTFFHESKSIKERFTLEDLNREPGRGGGRRQGLTLASWSTGKTSGSRFYLGEGAGFWGELVIVGTLTGNRSEKIQGSPG